MTPHDELIGIERTFWTDGVEAYRARVREDALFVFGGTGVIGKADAVRGLEAEPDGRWTDVRFSEVRAVEVSRDVTLVSYRVTARRTPGQRAMHALASSLYSRHGGNWTLLFHQQTPLAADG